jgi:hypothetical protein
VNWAQNLNYDRYGNMWASQAGLGGETALAWMPTAQSQISFSTNQLTTALGVFYDSGGNQTSCPGISASSPVQYDAENRHCIQPH